MPVKFYVPVNTGNLNVSDTTTVKDLDITGTVTGLNLSDISGLQPALDLKAPLESPTFTGVVRAPTAPSSTDDTTIATTAFVKTKIDEIIDNAPGFLNTLNDIAIFLGSNENMSTTLVALLGQKAEKTVVDTLSSRVDTVSSDITDLQSTKADKILVDSLASDITDLQSTKAEKTVVDTL
jgi:hypothetical protein